MSYLWVGKEPLMPVILKPRNLIDYFDRTYWPRKIGKSDKTRLLYLLTFARFGEFLGRAAKLDDLTDDSICAFLQARLRNKLSAATVSKDRDILCAVANFAARKRHLAEFPDVPQVPRPNRQPTAMRQDQIGAILTACKETPGRIGKAAAADWWYAYYVVSLTTGERTGAMHSLKWDWLRPDGWLPVPGNVRKTGKAETHHLPPLAMTAVERLRGWTEDRIFSAPFGLPMFWLRNKALLKRAGLPTTREWQPQMLRRTFASWLEAAGGNATEALQHSTRAVTRRSYLDPTIAVRASFGSIVAESMRLS